MFYLSKRSENSVQVIMFKLLMSNIKNSKNSPITKLIIFDTHIHVGLFHLNYKCNTKLINVLTIRSNMPAFKSPIHVRFEDIKDPRIYCIE